MLSRSRMYVRQDPDKDAKLFLIFCEGSKREPTYFNYFNQLNSRIRIKAIPADDQGNNSPTGLLEIAKLSIVKTVENPNPEYELNEGDEVWFVIDTDEWQDKITTLRAGAQENNWYVAQSNPCFEVWLYYHFFDTAPSFDGHDTSVTWKQKLSELKNGGFQLFKHPIYIQNAISNSEKNFSSILTPSATEVHILAKRFLPLVQNEIEAALKKIKLSMGESSN